jgi:hypothetical protein
MPSPDLFPQPKARKVDDIKSAILKPALTSHYELYLTIPNGNAGDFNTIMEKNGVSFSRVQSNLQLACSEASLPGSSLATHEINNDYTGVTERHAYRRVYDDRIDLTFYVDTQYTVIKFFETWIKYIVSESISGKDGGPAGLLSPNFFYSVRYPEEYQTTFYITKFEKDYTLMSGSRLVYGFLKAYPISISSMPISYDSSSLLKCTVSFNYSRYYIANLAGSPPPNSDSLQSSLNNPLEQAGFNTSAFESFSNPQFGVDTTGGLSIGNALSSGNSLQVGEGDEIIGAVNANSRMVESGLPYTGRNVGPLSPFS